MGGGLGYGKERSLRFLCWVPVWAALSFTERGGEGEKQALQQHLPSSA